MWSAFRDPSPHYFAHIELIPKVRSHLGNMIWGGSANLTAKKNGCKIDIVIYIYTCTHTYILRTYHQSMWMLANGHICWSIPSHFPNLVAEAPYILAGWIQKLPYFTRRANSQVWSAEVRRTSCCHCWWCMNLSSSTTHCAATWRQGRICGNGFAASWSCFLWLSPGCRPYRLYMISHDFSWCLGTILGGWW